MWIRTKFKGAHSFELFDFLYKSSTFQSSVWPVYLSFHRIIRNLSLPCLISLYLKRYHIYRYCHITGLEQRRVCRSYDADGQALVDNLLLFNTLMQPLYRCVQVHDIRLSVPVHHPTRHHCRHLHSHLLLPQGTWSTEQLGHMATSEASLLLCLLEFKTRVSLKGFVVCDLRKNTKENKWNHAPPFTCSKSISEVSKKLPTGAENQPDSLYQVCNFLFEVGSDKIISKTRF